MIVSRHLILIRFITLEISEWGMMRVSKANIESIILDHHHQSLGSQGVTAPSPSSGWSK